MAQWGRLKYRQQSCLGQTGKIMQQTGMAWPGARIGLAVSGGIDSWVMLKVMTLRQRIIPFDIELFVIHLNPGFDEATHAPLADWMREEGLAGHLETTDLAPGRTPRKTARNPPAFSAPGTAASDCSISANATT